MATAENFLVAAFGIGCELGRKVFVDFTGYGPEAFGLGAVVSN